MCKLCVSGVTGAICCCLGSIVGCISASSVFAESTHSYMCSSSTLGYPERIGCWGRGQFAAQYGEKHDNAAFGEEFSHAMTYFTRHSLQGGTQSLKDSYDWKGAKCIMDVGGGRGELLSSCMSWAGSDVKGVLFDRPFVIEG